MGSPAFREGGGLSRLRTKEGAGFGLMRFSGEIFRPRLGKKKWQETKISTAESPSLITHLNWFLFSVQDYFLLVCILY